MRLIANKPCSFGGQQFYIGDEISVNLIVDVRQQEKLGVITIVNDDIEESGRQSDTLFTQEQVEGMIAEAVEKAEKKRADQLAGMAEIESGTYDSMVQITVKGAGDKQFTVIPAKPEEIQQVFAIMQSGAEEGIKAIANVESENVLILLHAADSRKTIRKAAEEQAEKLASTAGGCIEPGNSTETIKIDKKGDEA